ncbi:hypothetical protein [Cellulomonas sp. C5510]|uniref:hypothetical protein n=1 Tax=Cellulomonas sp. C5510 TaxID=2871170 RepID=UPI001C93F091|nr:hypothetical protein [Cellulomonas sp. C5510]QZN86530.1 hypothetical protein K5O09_05120 [Cellulomonas sp. C5510]
MRRRAGTARAALLAGGAALAVVGLVVLLVQGIGLLTGTLRTGLADEGSCVAAATAGEEGAEITTSLLPPRSVCTWTVGGSPHETVLAEGSAPAVTAAVVAAAVGVTLVLGTAGVALVRRRRDVPPPV